MAESSGGEAPRDGVLRDGKQRRIAPVIMSGGSGTRLWPLSTEAEPKQFHPLNSALSLFQETALRVSGAAPGAAFLAPIVICNLRHESLVREQLAAVGLEPAAVALEPFGRNTAAVGAVAAALTEAVHPGALALLLPADHVIPDGAGFRAAVARAAPVAAERIVTFGIAPTAPETGYGYIQAGAPVAEGVLDVVRFVEKPPLETARAYLADGGYLWNAGIFLFSPSVLLEELGAFRPDIAEACAAAVAGAAREGTGWRLQDDAFARVPSQSLDVAVMERTRRIAVSPYAAGWADIGSWSELWRRTGRDAAGNVVRGPGAVLDSSGSLVWSTGPKLAVLGVTDLIVVATAEGVLVVPRDRAQEVKRLLDALSAQVPPPAQG